MTRKRKKISETASKIKTVSHSTNPPVEKYSNHLSENKERKVKKGEHISSVSQRGAKMASAPRHVRTEANISNTRTDYSDTLDNSLKPNNFYRQYIDGDRTRESLPIPTHRNRYVYK